MCDSFVDDRGCPARKMWYGRVIGPGGGNVGESQEAMAAIEKSVYVLETCLSNSTLEVVERLVGKDWLVASSTEGRSSRFPEWEKIGISLIGPMESDRVIDLCAALSFERIPFKLTPATMFEDGSYVLKE